MRDAWFAAGPIEMQQQVARSIQGQFWQDLPFIPLGQYFIDSAWRRDISGVQKGMALPINVRRG
jgi:peptide/nickel transport system substrate-binding protein